MEIVVTSGVGTGPTALAAFDAALLQAGIANFNLLVLTSVIPPASRVVEVSGGANPPGGWGDRLYVVLSEARVQESHAEAWAGLAWAQAEDGRGVFVEHRGHARAQVEADLHATTSALLRSRRGDYGPVRTRIEGIVCDHEPVCALVAAVFSARGW